MLAIKTILLPTDRSECSGMATAYARGLANQFGARVVALDVLNQMPRIIGDVRSDVLQAAQERHEEEA